MSLAVGLTEWLQLHLLLPSLTFQMLGTERQKVLLTVGTNALGYHGSTSSVIVGLTTQLDFQQELSKELTLLTGGSLDSGALLGAVPLLVPAEVALRLGFTLTPVPWVSFNFGLNGERLGAAQREPAVALGSVMTLGMRPLPLVQFHLSELLALDGHAMVRWTPGRARVETNVLAGVTLNW